MASINGITIKSLKSFRGHEWESCFQGNIYLDGKKLGFWTQDSWGGPDEYDFDESVLAKKVEFYKSGYEGDHKEFVDIDSLINSVLTLLLIEKDFKKGTKSGFDSAILITDKFHYNYLFANDDGKMLETHADYVEEAKGGMFKNEEPIVAILKKESFDIIVDENHKLPKYL